MPDIVHTEQQGDWVGYVWRRKEAPDQVTQYYWSLSFAGDVREMLEKSAQDANADGPATCVPDSCFYPSEDEARRNLNAEIQRHGTQ